MRMEPKMKNIFAKISLTLLVPLCLVSCLEKTPSDKLLIDEGMETLNGADQLCNGVYTKLMSGALYSGYLTLCPDIQSDLVYAVQGNSNTYGNIWMWDIRSTTSEIGSVYAALYSVIGSCNYFLDGVDDLRARLSDDEEIQYLDHLHGEVLCARALAYSELAKCFCKAYNAENASGLGLVLSDSFVNEAPKKRASLEETYRFIIADLEKACELFSSYSDQANAPYFSYGAAQALWARVCLYMEDWDGAIEHSSYLLDSGVYALADANALYTSGKTYLQYMWTNDASYEVIFKIGYTSTSYGSPIGQVFLNFNRDFTYYYPDFVPATWVLNLYNSADLRYDAYFTELQTGYSHALVWPLLTKYMGNEGLMSNYIYHVCMPKPLRLAEQYLIRSEAYCRKGQFSKANADINALRQKRYSTGGTVSMNEDSWLDIISDERVRELFMEGFRLQDLKRWGRGFERTPQTSCQSEGSSMKVTADDPLFVWPIPRNEIEAPGSEIEGNESNR